MIKNLVVFHDPCMDGFCSVWIANKFLKDVELKPTNYGEKIDLDDFNDKYVFILDFSYKTDIIEEICKRCIRLTVLDHHKTAQAELEPLIQKYKNSSTIKIIFDIEHSGAHLTWNYFAPNQDVPWVVDYVEDRDLWKWKLPNSREINAALYSYPKEFAVWDQIIGWFSERLAIEGRAILRYQDQLIDQIIKHKYGINLDGHQIDVVNSPILQSELAGKLAQGKPFAGVWYQHENKIRFSLRSDKNGLDVSEIAKKYNGGGHRQAAGFEIDKAVVS